MRLRVAREVNQQRCCRLCDGPWERTSGPKPQALDRLIILSHETWDRSFENLQLLRTYNASPRSALLAHSHGRTARAKAIWVSATVNIAGVSYLSECGPSARFGLVVSLNLVRDLGMATLRDAPAGLYGTATPLANTGNLVTRAGGSEMRVLIATAGGRGDVAPFTGLATAIRAAGHGVTITSNDEYESLVGCGLDFRPLPGTHGMFFDDPRWIQELGGPAAAPKLIRLLAEHVRTLNKAILAVARQDAPDVLALSGIATVGGYHVAEGLGLPGMDLQLMPTHPTADFPPSFLSGRSFGRVGNRAAGMAMSTALALAMARPTREIGRELGLPRRELREALSGQLDGSRWPVLHGFSPSVVPLPQDWPAGYEVTGYWWPQRPDS
jgi:Glycosyltransferase family 28 N-terminal domain